MSMDKVCRKSARRLNVWRVPGICWKQPAGWQSEFAHRLRNRRPRPVLLDARFGWPPVLEKTFVRYQAEGAGCCLLFFLYGSPTKTKGYFLSACVSFAAA